jgi:hypothetical protein
MDLVLLALNSPPFVWITRSSLADLQSVAEYGVDLGTRLTRMICARGPRSCKVT